MKGFINGFCGIVTGVFILGMAITFKETLDKVDYIYEKEKRMDESLSMVKL